MKYSTEEIYKYSGQYNKTVSIVFQADSGGFRKFERYITGTFYYTPAERQRLQEVIQCENSERTDGLIKVESTDDRLSEEQKEELIRLGVNASDIFEILQYNRPVENEFSKTDLRKLPDPLEIEVDVSSTDPDEMFLWLTNAKLSTGYKLIPCEIDKHNGIILRKYENQLHADDLKHFVDDTGKIKSGIRYEYLKSKFYKDLLTEEEKSEFFEKTGETGKERAAILVNELKKSNERLKKIGTDYKKELTILMYLTSTFETERLNAGKFPVWWDFERFIHIFMRHVKETKVGARFKSKTEFQYKLRDIKRLVETVIKKIESEIQQHFIATSTKEFKRIGERSVYYNGDYYAIQISTDGKLMRFHKNN